MTVHTRLIAAVVATAIGMTGLVLAQGAGTPPPQGQEQTPAPAAGRGAGGQRGAGQAGRQGGGGRRGGFTQFTRELAPQDVSSAANLCMRPIVRPAMPSICAADRKARTCSARESRCRTNTAKWSARPSGSTARR